MAWRRSERKKADDPALDIPDIPASYIPDLPEPILAYRYWRYSPFGLISTNQVIVWPVRETLIASCLASPSCPPDSCPCPNYVPKSPSTPHAGSGCGIYALKSWADVLAHSHPFVRVPVIWGEVLIGGKVFEHEWLYRAECAYPHRLYLPPNPDRLYLPPNPATDEWVTGLAAAYNIPAVPTPPHVRTANLQSQSRGA